MAKNSPQEIKNREYFSTNLKNLLNEYNKKQIDLHRDLKIPKSTITGYIKGTSLPNPGNLQKIADYFKVKKSELDLRFKNDNQIDEIHNTELEIKTIVDNLLSGMSNKHTIMYDGEPIDDVTKELVRASIEQAARIALAGKERK